MKKQIFILCKECKKMKGNLKFSVIESNIFVCKHVHVLENDLTKKKK